MGSRRLEVVIAGNAAGATRALREVGAATGGAERKMSSLRRVGGALAGVFAGVQLTQFFRNTVVAAEEAATVMRQTEAVIRSTGGAAGVSAGDLQRLSARLSEMAGVDDELVQQGGNVLLTFTNIKAQGGIFDDALTSALDMSSALGGDLQGSIMMIGRALNSPADGLSRLTRAGVTFSDAQRTQIEQMAAFGNTAGAQRVILDELAREFGGAAAANATSSGRMQVAWENLQEQIGTGLLPAVSALADGMTSINEAFSRLSGPVQQVATVIGLVGAAALAAGAIFGSVWAAVGVVAIAAVGAQIFAVWRLTQPLRDLFFAVVGQLQQWWQAAQPIRDVMVQIGTTAAAAVAMVVAKLQEWWIAAQPVRNMMSTIGGMVLGALRTSVGWVLSALQLWWQLSAPVRSILNIIGSIGLYALRSAISNVIAFIRTAYAASQPLRSVLQVIGGFAWGVLKSAISTVTTNLRNAWNATSPLRSALSALGSMALGTLSAAIDGIRSGFAAVSSLLDSIASKIRNLPSPGDVLSALNPFKSGPEIGGKVMADPVAIGASSSAKARGASSIVGGDIVIVHQTVLDGQVLERSVTRHQRAAARAYADAGGAGY